METEKAVGYVLLSLGLSVIFFALFSAVSVFGGEKKPPSLLKIERSSKPISIGGIEIPALDLVPTDYLSSSGNYFLYILFMWLLISAGGKIASIGVSLIAIKRPAT